MRLASQEKVVYLALRVIVQYSLADYEMVERITEEANLFMVRFIQSASHVFTGERVKDEVNVTFAWTDGFAGKSWTPKTQLMQFFHHVLE